MEVEAAKMIGAGLAVISLAGVGVGIGNVFSALVTSIARNPAARGEVFGIGILGSGAMGAIGRNPEAAAAIQTNMILAIAFAEALGIYALITAVILLFVG